MQPGAYVLTSFMAGMDHMFQSTWLMLFPFSLIDIEFCILTGGSAGFMLRMIFVGHLVKKLIASSVCNI